MRLRNAAMALGISFAASMTVLGGCDTIGPTKVAHGELYQSGDGRYDNYFNAVHQEQLASAQWADESKAARKPIITALNLRSGSSNSTILSATREKKGDASLGSPIEQTTSAELDRARRLTAAAAKLEEMQKRGEELKKQTAEDKKNLGADKADEKKSAKKDEVKREMTAAVDAVDEMASDARKFAKEAEELAAKLKAAWTGKAEDERPGRGDEKKDDKKDDKKPEKKPEKKDDKKPEPVAKKAQPKAEPAKKPAAAAPAPASEEKKAPPAQKPADEVFNP